jgi:hypothetical protein
LRFISLPDHVQRETCAKYQLDWIGPETSPRSQQI